MDNIRGFTMTTEAEKTKPMVSSCFVCTTLKNNINGLNISENLKEPFITKLTYLT